DNQDSKEKEELTAYVTVDENKKLIRMGELTFKELLWQSYHCLEARDFQKINEENVKLQLMDEENNYVESDEDVKREFKRDDPTFHICWTPFQLITGKRKIIKNALVVMVAISEYTEDTMWRDLPNVQKEDSKNFEQLFKQELNYEMECNPHPSMTRQEIQDFIDQTIHKHDLVKNTKKYDGLIMIFCGHGEYENMFIASDGKRLSIDKIRSSLNCNEMESFKDIPKIFIIDVCRGENIPRAHKVATRGKEVRYGHCDDGFLIIWSTTKGYRVADLSLLSKSMKNIVTSKYKNGQPFKQILQEIRTHIRNNKSSEWYCVESQDTTDYDIIFQQRKFV
ncbi:hypothetical protein RFI_11690, partial [Reticulomyxa filosa]